LLGALAAAGLFGALELGLRLSSVVKRPSVPPSPAPFQEPYSMMKVQVSAQGRSEWTVCGGSLTRSCLRKPAGLRVLVCGGSSVLGLPHSPLGSFSAWLERYLAHLTGGKPVEVINNGILGAGSAQVLENLRDNLLWQRPDLVIIYSGNNEFYSLRARKGVLPHYSPELELWRHRLWGLHAYRLLAQLRAPREPPRPQGTADYGAPVEDADRRLAVRLYRNNLDQMIAAARGIGVPVMLVTVPTPIAHKPSAEEWARDSAELAALLGEPALVGSDPSAQLKRVRAKAGARDTYAAHYLLGRLERRAGDVARARAHFLRAEAMDPNPLRCNEDLRAAMRALGRQRHVPVCDAAAALDAVTRDGIPDEDYFSDWCHPSPMAHRHLARALVGCLARARLLPISPGEGGLAQTFARAELRALDPFRLDTGMAESERATVDGPERPDDPLWHMAAAREHLRAVTNLRSQPKIEQHRFPRLKKALKHLDRARALGVGEGTIALNRGLLNLYLHQPAMARSALTEAVGLLPGDPTARNLAAICGAAVAQKP